MSNSTQILKTCNLCGVPKPLDDFHIKAHAPDGRNYRCKECAKSYRKQHYRENPEQYRQYYETTGRYRHLKTKYGVDETTYNHFLTQQNGLCAICKSPPPELRPFHLDHDHITGKPRGLLCARCNTMLSYFGDRPEGLVRVLEYVQRGE